MKSRGMTTTVMSIVGLLLASGASAQVVRYTARAMNIAPGAGRGEGTIVDIVINRWSSDEEGRRLIKAFTAKGQREMLAEMQKVNPPIGRIGITGETTYHLRYAEETDLEDGMTQILIATDREMSYEEVVEKPPSFDYPFTLIELHVDKNGEGEGRVSIATRVVWDKKANVLELENFTSAPVWLKKVPTEAGDLCAMDVVEDS